MNNKIKYLIVIGFIFFLNTNYITAMTLKSEDIEPSTYVIGTHTFSRNINDNYNGRLTTKLLMLAAKTIAGNSIDDIMIYYKTASGVWIDGLTGEQLTVPEEFEINYIDTLGQITTPELSIVCSQEDENGNCISMHELGDDGYFEYDLSINGNATYYNDAKDKEISYKIYEVNDDQYTEVGGGYYSKGSESLIGHPETIVVKVALGEKKTYAAKVFAKLSDNSVIESEYSNEVVINHETVKAPKLSIACANKDENGTCLDKHYLENGYYQYDVSVDKATYIDINSNLNNYGYDVYEKNGTRYTKVGGGMLGSPEVVAVQVEVGTTKTFVAVVYGIDKNGNRIESDYSEELIINHTKIETPIIVYDTSFGPPLTADPSIDGVSHYIYVNNDIYGYDSNLAAENNYENQNYGYEFYEKNGSELTKFGDSKYIVRTVEVPFGTKKTYVARVYAIKHIGNKEYKVYSDYSNEITVDNTTIEAPTLSIACGAGVDENGVCLDQHNLEDDHYSYDLQIDKKMYTAGTTTADYTYQIFEKDGERYTEVGGGTLGHPEVVNVLIEDGTKKTYVARVYVIKENGEKLYSDYSEELVIDHSN